MRILLRTQLHVHTIHTRFDRTKYRGFHFTKEQTKKKRDKFSVNFLRELYIE